MESIDSLAKAINKFEGGMVLVSHDMRLISQVAQEIWVVDNNTVMKYVGEIADFKMQVKFNILLFIIYLNIYLFKLLFFFRFVHKCKKVILCKVQMLLQMLKHQF